MTTEVEGSTSEDAQYIYISLWELRNVPVEKWPKREFTVEEARAFAAGERIRVAVTRPYR